MVVTMVSVLVLVFLLQQVKCELLVNIALHRTPTQNAELTYSDAKIVSTVDGNKNCLTGNEFIWTAPLLDPWWQLDLGGVYIIPVVHVLGQSRNDTLSGHLVGFHLTAGFTENQLSLVYRNDDTVYNDGDIWINTTIIAKIIRINLPNYTVSNNHTHVSLVLCEVEIYTLTNEHIKQNSNVSMSTVYSALNKTFGSDLAIDGIYPTSEDNTPELCYCCSITGSERSDDNLWWTIDFGQPRLIGGIYITGRREMSQQYQSKNTRIYISNTVLEPTEAEFGEAFWYINSSEEGYLFQHIFPQPSFFQYMLIIRSFLETHHLTICEVDFITPVCPQGHYGTNCLACKDGFFGYNCNEACGNCSNAGTCNKTDGTCSGLCDPGYDYTADRTCKTECKPGHYGINCSETCGYCIDGVKNCSFIDGTCPGGCALGYEYTSNKTCKAECQLGRYGFNCSQICGQCLNGTAKCSSVNGTCSSGCAPGYYYTEEMTCNIECEPGTYGYNCSKECGLCSDGYKNCSKTTGVCDQKQCAEGYTGDTCQKNIYDVTKTIVGAVLGVGAFVIAVIVLVVILKRRGFFPKSKTEGTHFVANSVLVSLETPAKKRDKPKKNSGKAVTSSVENTSHEYYVFNHGDHVVTNRIKIRDLWDYITSKRANDFQELFEDFQAVPAGCQFECSVAIRDENTGKNKYRNMYPYDHCRVKLKVPEGQSDYINASHVDGYERIQKFIAAQGPRLGTIEDFWMMVWQQNVRKVVMLTNMVEMGKDKCDQYWPDVGTSVQYGGIHVTLKATIEKSDFIIRKLELRMENEKVRRVEHFHFKSWPDKDVPDSTWCLVNFWRVVMDKDQGKFPIVVHCSAGIGRTGTFIALDLLYNQAVAEGGVTPVGVLETLRRQRINLVQTKYQYAYLHEALAETLLIGTHFYWANQLPSVCNFFNGRHTEATATRAQEQYKLICECISSTDDQQQAAAAAAVAPAENIYEETGDPMAEPEYGNISTPQSEKYRPKTKNRNSASMQQMNAIYLPNYAEATTYILAKTPSDSSLPYFWSLVEEQNVTTIINLTETTHPYYQTSCALGATDDKPVGRFSVRVVKEIENRDYVSRSIVYGEIGKKGKTTGSTVKMFTLSVWQPGSKCPSDIDPLMAFLEEANKWHPHVSEAKPVLFICGNGRTRCGLVAAIFNESQRMRNEEGHVNIVETVMMMKKQTGDIISEEQFQFLYKAVFTYAKRIGYVVNDDKYQNV